MNIIKFKNNIKTIKSIRVYGFSLPIIMSDFKYRQKIFGKCALLVKHYNPKSKVKSGVESWNERVLNQK